MHLELFVSNVNKLIQKEKCMHYSPFRDGLVPRGTERGVAMPEISEAVYFFPGCS